MSEWVIITNKGFASDDWIGRSVIEPADVLSGKVGEEQLKKAQLKLGNDFQRNRYYYMIWITMRRKICFRPIL